MLSYEAMLQASQNEAEKAVGPAKTAFRQAQGECRLYANASQAEGCPVSLKKQGESLDKFRAHCINQVNNLQTRVLALELENKVLKAKMESYKKEHAEVNGVLTSIQTWAAQADQSIEHLSDDSSYMMGQLRQLDAHLEDQLLALPDPGDFGKVHSQLSGESSPFTCGSFTTSPKSTSPGSLVAELVRASEPSESHASEVLIPVSISCDLVLPSY